MPAYNPSGMFVPPRGPDLGPLPTDPLDDSLARGLITQDVYNAAKEARTGIAPKPPPATPPPQPQGEPWQGMLADVPGHLSAAGIPENLAAAYASQASGFTPPEPPRGPASAPPRSLAQAPGYAPVNPMQHAYGQSEQPPAPDVVSGGATPPPDLSVRRPGPGLASTVPRPAPPLSPQPNQLAAPLPTTSQGLRRDLRATQQAELASMGREGEATRAAAEAEAQGAIDIGKHYANTALTQQAAAKQYQENEVENQRKLGEFMGQHMARVEELKNSKVDPFRLTRDLGAGNTALLILGSMFSGAAARGGPNQTIQALERAQDKDISAQEHAIATKKAIVADDATIYQQLRLQGVDKQTATLMAKDMNLEATKNLIQGVMQTTKSKVALKNGEVTYEQATQRQGALRAEIDQREAARIAAESAAAANRPFQVARQLGELDEQQARIAKLRSEGKESEAKAAEAEAKARGGGESPETRFQREKDDRARFSPFLGRFFKSAPAAEEYEKKLQPAMALIGPGGYFEQAATLKEQIESGKIPPAQLPGAVQKLNSLQALAETTYAGEAGTVIRDSLKEHFGEATGNIGSFFSSPGRIRAAGKAARAGFIARAQGSLTDEPPPASWKPTATPIEFNPGGK